MIKPHPWKHGWADAHAARNDLIADEFLETVVRPSLRVLNQKHHEYLASDDPVMYGFAASDQLELISKTSMAFCLSIQSLWEQQIRGYLCHCVKYVPIADIDLTRLQVANWGKEFNGIFKAVRGLDLQSFDSYQTLSLLHLLGNACRHGDGASSRKLFKRYPHLWPEWARGEEEPAFQLVRISEELLEGFVNAIVLFWMDFEISGLKTLSGKGPADRIACLKLDRQQRLDTITRLVNQKATLHTTTQEHPSENPIAFSDHPLT